MGSARSVNNTTSTGIGSAVSVEPSLMVTAAVVVNGTGTGSFTVEKSAGGGLWTSFIAASTYANSRIITSTSTSLFTGLRATITANASTNPVSVFLTAR